MRPDEMDDDFIITSAMLAVVLEDPRKILKINPSAVGGPI